PKVAKGKAQAVVMNSGNANTCNGEQGLKDAEKMASESAEALGIPVEYTLVASTGVIGQRMPMDKIIKGIKQSADKLRPDGGLAAAEAIMTTDTVAKEYNLSYKYRGETITVGGMAKGSGMIHPDMATMLGFITTDAAISAPLLDKALRHAADCTFNMISIDGDTSTNDMVLALANGAAGKDEITSEDEGYHNFVKALVKVCRELAVQVARDGEGATKLLEVRVVNAPTEKDARIAARAVASSSLVKSAVFGKDANWGRIICAVGYSGADFDPENVDIFIGDMQVAKDGGALDFDEEKGKKILSDEKVVFLIDLKAGGYSATAWGCDLTYDYVKINASYRT
ncbi:MAG TPA: bifunctional glutamate N-acetyltransferase/amino-acid acetyltransferase ArgJ, partial [Clostridia bacterium]|nr:bifunctional glutamate N-acetyltransferase/amino-acid acetyltransferase ArgJ [Clostridia bacterium]